MKNRIQDIKIITGREIEKAIKILDSMEKSKQRRIFLKVVYHTHISLNSLTPPAPPLTHFPLLVISLEYNKCCAFIHLGLQMQGMSLEVLLNSGGLRIKVDLILSKCSVFAKSSSHILEAGAAALCWIIQSMFGYLP